MPRVFFLGSQALSWGRVVVIYMLLLGCGICSGFLAGLLGMGGGFVVVPALLFVLPLLNIDAVHVPTVAVATSLAAMVPTAMSAVLAQYRKDALRVEWVRLLAPGVALGSAMGSKVALAVNGFWITLVFTLYAVFFALRMIRPPAAGSASRPRAQAPDPGLASALPQWTVGVLIGGLSSLAGVGGASLVVPYLLSRDAGMRQASAASSAVGLVIALVGAAGFSLAPVNGVATVQNGLVGFVCWPAALAIGTAALTVAPLGVALAHRLPVSRLKQAFAIVLLIVAAASLAKALS
jgi:uncharacterized membrane protein YfcA